MTNQPTIREICEEFRRLDAASDTGEKTEFWRFESFCGENMGKIVAEVERLQKRVKELGTDKADLKEHVSKLEAQNAALQKRVEELEGKTKGRCSHCGQIHALHVGCSSDWTGVDKHGR